MVSISNIIFYIFIFLTVYAQVFLLVTFLENRKRILIRKGRTFLLDYPEVTVIVPAFNEEKNLKKTVNSLLNLNYHKHRVKIILVDDGSTDNTWKVMQEFSVFPNIRLMQKRNGGKYTALNLGLESVETPFVGCMDADSVADPDALVRIMSYFEKDPELMAVTPSLITHQPKTLVQKAQKMEYLMSVYFKKMLGILSAIHVAPGPLTIFRKKVFEELGPYRHAHNTEDMEIAYRMQKNNYKIEHCNDAYVYTGTPSTIGKLFRQRLRWIYGFLNNTLDYRDVLFKKKYGNFSFFTLPAGVVSVVGVTYLLGRLLYSLGDFVFNKISHYQLVGFNFGTALRQFDVFFLSTKSFIFLEILIFGLVIFSMLLGAKMVEGKWKFSAKIFYYLAIFSAVAPLWLVKAIWNTLLSKRPAWR